MKNIGTLIVHRLCIAFLWATGAFFCACGLDETFEINAPTQVHKYSTYDTADPLSWYCDFSTVSQPSNISDGSSLNYLGTGVYYKIYNNYSTLLSQRSSITSLNTSSNGSSAATRMIQTLTYQPLGTNPNLSWSVFVRESGTSSHRVRFRLKSAASASNESGSITSETPLLAMIAQQSSDKINYIGYASGEQYYTYDSATDTWTGSDSAIAFSDIRFVVPFRYDNAHSFDFFDDNDDDKDNNRDIEPVDGDSDYYYTSTASEDDTYYVQLFAVSIARSGTYEMTYSLVLDLGVIPIKKGQ